MTLDKLGVVVMGVVTIGVLVVSFFRPMTVQVLSQQGDNTTPPPYGATAGGDFYQQADFFAGEVRSGAVATTSNGGAVTAAEFRNWIANSVVQFKPSIAAVTVTMPASSTISAVLPKSGDRSSICIFNATSTAGTKITLASGLGTQLRVASSSGTALGGLQVDTGATACITFIRQNATSTGYDIDGLVSIFK